MRNTFPGYYKPTQQEILKLWDNAIIVLDTNALFNLFRYSNKTRAEFLSVLESKREQLWIPYQVGLEFHEGRLQIIKDQIRAFDDLITKSDRALESVINDVGALRNHPTLDLNELKETIRSAVETVKTTIHSTRKKYQTEVLDASRHDETTDKIAELYLGRVGKPYTQDRLEKIYKDGEKRYEIRKPPGYKDANKPEPKRYGDLVLWYQILDKAESSKSAVIFVSEDQKEDWWREFDGKKIGPRVELIDEFMHRTGERAYFVTPPGLVELANEHGASINVETVREVTEVSEELARIKEKNTIAQRKNGTSRSLSRKLESKLHDLQYRLQLSWKAMRDLDEKAANLDPKDPNFHDLNTEIQSERAYLHWKIRRLKRDINQATEEIDQLNSSPRSTGSEKPHWSQLLDAARIELEFSDIPTINGETSWFEVSDESMNEIIHLVDTGVLPGRVERKIQELTRARRKF